MALMQPHALCVWTRGVGDGRRGEIDIGRDYERWHVSLSGLQTEPLLKAFWQYDSH